MKKHISFVLMLAILFTCFCAGGAAAEAGTKYRDLENDFLSQANQMEEEPNDSFDDADGLENEKWTGAILTFGSAKDTDWDYYFAQLTAGKYYSLQLTFKDASLGDIGFSLLMKDKKGEKKILGLNENSDVLEIATDLFDEKNAASLIKAKKDCVLFVDVFFMSKAIFQNNTADIPYMIMIQDVTEAVSTPKPGPNISDMKGCDSRVTVPESGNWLPAYLTKTVKSSLGNGIILRYMPDSEFGYDGYNNLDFLADGTVVTELARQNGFSLIKTGNGQVGWVQSKHLV